MKSKEFVAFAIFIGIIVLIGALPVYWQRIEYIILLPVIAVIIIFIDMIIDA